MQVDQYRLHAQVPHVYHCTKFSSEVQLPAFSSYPNVFNDTVITTHFNIPDHLVIRGELPVDVSQDGLEIIEGNCWGGGNNEAKSEKLDELSECTDTKP